MADHEDWTAQDDAQLRGALATLRQDVDLLPLPDVRFVRARGVRRRRQRALALTAAAAAAAVVIGAVGYGQLGRDSTLPATPATQSTAPVPTAAPTAAPTNSATDPIAEPDALPLVTDWTSSLGLTGSTLLTPVKPFEAVECLDVEPGTKVQQAILTQRTGSLSGGQVRFSLDAGTDAGTAASGVANDISDCALAPGFHVDALTETAAGSLFAYTAGDAGSGWFAVVHGKRDVAVLQVVDPDHAKSVVTGQQVEALATIAQERLTRYGTGTAGSGSPSATSTTPQIGPTGSTRALSQDMPVAGPRPVPASPLFVAASQWRSPALSGDVTTTAGPGALEGSTAIASCETTEQQAGIGGRVGVVSVRAGTSATSYVGHQRVQLDESTGAAVQQTYVAARLDEAKALYGKGCKFGNGTVTSTAGPSQGTYRLDTVFTDGSPTLSEWVGVTAQKTSGAVSTIVITKLKDQKQGFAELDRLLMLARQK
ncbi:hypothetical protein [Pedococcus soli]